MIFTLCVSRWRLTTPKYYLQVRGSYLTVCPWSPDFCITQSGIESQMVWIRLPGLLEGYYLECLLRVIGQTIGTIIKLDVHTDGGRRGRFTRLAVCVDLRRPLVSKLWINGKLQRVEYEGFLNICFKCGRFGHVLDGYMEDGVTTEMDVFEGSKSIKEVSGLDRMVVEESFGSWMVVERRKERGRAFKEGNDGCADDSSDGSMFLVLNMKDRDFRGKNHRRVNGKDLMTEIIFGNEGNGASLGLHLRRRS